MLDDTLPLVADLIRTRRAGALGTLDAGAPYVSHVACAPAADLAHVVLLLSGLSPHTRHLHADPRCSLLLTEPVLPDTADVLQLARITLLGSAHPIAAAEHAVARASYLAHLPEAEMLFTLGDFTLFRLTITGARYIGGFARALTLMPTHLRTAAGME